MSRLLHDRVAIITGAGRGIGRAVAQGFAAQGAAVVVNDIDAEVCASTAAEIQASGGVAVCCTGAMGDEADAANLVATALKVFGGLHILVNAAATLLNAPLHEMTLAQFDRVIRVHLYGTFFTMRAAAAVMRKQRYGRIINVVSRAGLRGYPREANYAAAKAGIVALSLTAAQEWMADGITVNCISPVAWTRNADSLPEPERSASRAARAQNVLGRVALPEDTVPTFLFLASDQSAYLTGQIVHATGQPVHLM
ncbi:MAG TPA: SDR family oxidoreductase [Chloroflexaceae bacterium]|nr:SDR family oxidoreductase [Chloroflexaceae bacterium]